MKPRPTPSVGDGETTAAADHDMRLWVEPYRLQGAQLTSLCRSVEHGAAIHGVALVGLVAAFWSTPHRLAVMAIAAITACILGGIVAVGRAGLCDRLPPRHARAGGLIAKAIAVLLGTAWAAVPLLLFPAADESRQLIVLAALAAVLADSQRLGAERTVGIAYVAPICAASFAGLAMSGSFAGIALACAAPFYGWFLVSRGAATAALETGRLADAAIVTAQRETIHTLLLDFDEEASDWLWRTEADGRLVAVSGGTGAAVAAFEAALEGPLAALFARPGARPNDNARNLLAVMAAKKPFRNRLIEVAAEGDAQWWRLSGKPVFDPHGAFLGYRGVGSDVSGARNSESRIAYLANFDALTGFANRTSFQAFAARQCLAAAADGHCRALLCLDLDGFKGVNDSLGHEGGDELLKQVAARLTAIVPGHTVLARIGGDEFAIWVQNTTPAKAESVANALVETMRTPFDINGIKVEIGGSIGIALTPKHGTDPENLLVKADLALYRAKTEGRGRAKLFEEIFETSIIERRKLEGDIKLALARGEFTLHFQPLVEMTEGRIVCFEALIRWQSPERGFVPPGDFIPAAESSGLIAAVGRYVLFEACRIAAAWPQEIQVAVNVSPPHVRSSDFLQDVTMALKASGLHPSRLQIEVTEGVFLDKSDAASAALQTLRSRGIKIALDDFGTGYSSLNYLVDFPVDKIKIDRAFVRDIVDSNAHQAVVDAMLGLAKKLSIRVTAEGVETKEQALALKRRRCDDIQGYLISKPRPAGDVPAMIDEAPVLFRQAIPTHMESPLAMALATRKAGTSQAA